MNSDNRYFQEALTHFTAEFAYVGAVRHLYDLGLLAAEIKQQLSYPVSAEKIEKVIREYEYEKAHPEKSAEYVRDVDAFGRGSFRKVK